MKLSSNQLRKDAKNWRLRINWIIGIGLLIVFVLAIQAARVINFWTGEEQLSFGAFLVFFLALGLPVVGFAMPYIMMTQAMEGLSEVVGTLDGLDRRHHAEASAQRLYRQAQKWRTFAGWVAVIVGIIGFISAINSSQDYYGDTNGGALLLSLVTLAIGIGVGLMPYLILSTIIQGVGTAVEGAARVRAEVDAAKVRSIKRTGDDKAPESADSPDTTRPRRKRPDPPPSEKTQAELIAELSKDARRVAGAIGAMGSASQPQVAEKLGLYPGDVLIAVNQLTEAGLVRQIEPGLFEYVAPEEEAPQPAKQQIVYCVTCRYPISESLVEGPHKGHETRPM